MRKDRKPQATPISNITSNGEPCFPPKPLFLGFNGKVGEEGRLSTLEAPKPEQAAFSFSH